MGAYLYDEALLSKFKYWTEGTQVNIVGPEETSRLYQTIADQTGDKPLQLPIISITRNGGYTVGNINKRPITYNGKVLTQTEETASMLNSIPITISYRVDVYTRFLKEADMYARNLVFNLINFPTLTIEVPYQDSKFKHHATVRISSDIEDTSATAMRLAAGQLTRLTLSMDIDDAYLWDVRVVNNVSIDDENTLYIQNPDKLTFESETIPIN